MATAAKTAMQRSYEYAQRNGYAGTYDEYVRLQWNVYVETCDRMDVPHKPFEAWLAHQEQ